MRRRRFFLLFLIPFLMTACGLLHTGISPLPEHPPVGMKRPQCIDCHDKTDPTFPYAKFNHDVFFTDGHRVEALTGSATCYLCHTDGFCGDCHDGRQEMMPTTRRPMDIQRRIPHRGKYLARHQIEGRINPLSCYRCHGKPDRAERCVTCHGE